MPSVELTDAKLDAKRRGRIDRDQGASALRCFTSTTFWALSVGYDVALKGLASIHC